jgi:integrase
MAGSIYPVRSTACRRECGGDSRTCPRRRSGHTGWGFVTNLVKLDTGKWPQIRRQSLSWTKADAERALVKEAGDINSGRALPLASRQVTVSEYAATWLHDVAADLRPSSLHAYRHVIDSYVICRYSGLGSIKLAELNAAQLRWWRERVRAGEIRTAQVQARRPDGTLHPRTVNRIVAIVRTMLTAAVEDKLITANPASGIKALKVTRDEKFSPTVWTPAQAETFLAWLDAGHGPGWAPVAFRIALMLGLRRGEIAALRWQDIDLAAGYLTVARNAVQFGGKVVTGDPKSGSGERTIPLSMDPALPGVLRAARKRQVARLDGLVVCDEQGEAVPPWKLSDVFRHLVEDSGLPPMRLHDCRHHAGSVAYEATRDIKAVQKLLGHSTVAITADLYIHVSADHLDQAAAQVAAYRQQRSH